MIDPIDRTAGLALRSSVHPGRIFTGGWGDLSRVAALHLERQGDPVPINPVWGPWSDHHGLGRRDGVFPSPAPNLPASAATAVVREVRPPRARRGIVVLMAAWNDHGYDTRQALARGLARHGLGTVILENPYYGSRRPKAGLPVETVTDFMVMGWAALQEGRSLVTHLGSLGPVGVSGYSMGGSIAALIAASVDHPVSVAPLAASPSPANVYLDGVLRHGIDWEALGGPEAEERLWRELDRASALRLPPPRLADQAVLVAGRHDGFVLPSATAALHDHWPGSTMRSYAGGHGTLLWWRHNRLVDAIVDSFGPW